MKVRIEFKHYYRLIEADGQEHRNTICVTSTHSIGPRSNSRRLIPASGLAGYTPEEEYGLGPLTACARWHFRRSGPVSSDDDEGSSHSPPDPPVFIAISLLRDLIWHQRTLRFNQALSLGILESIVESCLPSRRSLNFQLERLHCLQNLHGTNFHLNP